MDHTISVHLTDDEYIRGKLIRRDKDAHKGNFGKVLIFAGSPGMAGAAVLNGRAALKSGAGLVQYLLPDLTSPLLPILQICVPEATCVPLTEAFCFSNYSAISCGSGLGTAPEQQEILSRILEQYEGPLVLDADALNMIAKSDSLKENVRKTNASVIITPHIGEAKRLLSSNGSISGKEQRLHAACSLAKKYHCIAVLKGSGTLVAWMGADSEAGEFPVYENTTGNPGMATAGSGDCLAGLIASLAAQGYAPQEAARMGVFIHGKAGDLAASDVGEMGMTASDIVTNLPFALKQYYD